LEIIKRLINHQLLEQHKDKQDKRGKHFKIAPLGQSEFSRLLKECRKYARLFPKN
jgi:DNA-binding MarR family transcriptional regulator